MTMRTMLRWTVPTARGNEAIKDGSIGATIEGLMEQLRPEAAYFMAWEGKRSGMIVFDMAEPSQIPLIAEQLFLALDADVEFIPVMNADDLKKALAQVG
jgi:hypothetical protein